MIGSKKLNLIAILLLGIVLIFTVYAMMFYSGEKTEGGTVQYSESHALTFTADDYETEGRQEHEIRLEGSGAVSKSANVTSEDGIVTVRGSGAYRLTGNLSGSLYVDAPDGAEVHLILDNASIAALEGAALYVKEAGKVVLTLSEGSQNTLTDSSLRAEGDDASAALYSKDSLTVNGTGSLTVNGNYEDGIKVNDTLKIMEGSLTVTAADDGINTNDAFAALAASLTVESGGDALKCEEESEEKGFLAFTGTTLSLKSTGDGISASSSAYFENITADITAGGKGAKAVSLLSARDGAFTVTSTDDSLHSDGDLTLSGGTFTLSTEGDGLHAEKTLTLCPETLNVTQSLEGLEGARIQIDGGNISVTASDDGINAVGENSTGGMPPMGMGGEAKVEEEDFYLVINGGDILIETGGDGIDSNGSAKILGGRVRVYGPENDGNGSIDVGDGGYVLSMEGGTLMAAGSSGMAEYPYEGSLQPTLVFYLDETYGADSKIELTDTEGTVLFSDSARKRFNFVAFSDIALTVGNTYILRIDGSEVGQLTPEGTVSTLGEGGFGMMGFGRR